MPANLGFNCQYRQPPGRSCSIDSRAEPFVTSAPATFTTFRCPVQVLYAVSIDSQMLPRRYNLSTGLCTPSPPRFKTCVYLIVVFTLEWPRSFGGHNTLFAAPHASRAYPPPPKNFLARIHYPLAHPRLPRKRTSGRIDGRCRADWYAIIAWGEIPGPRVPPSLFRPSRKPPRPNGFRRVRGGGCPKMPSAGIFHRPVSTPPGSAAKCNRRLQKGG